MKNRIIKIIKFEEMWFFLWVILWAIYLFIKSEAGGFEKNYLLVSGYFIFATVLLIIIFKDYLKFILPKKRSIIPILALLLAIAFSFTLYYSMNSYFEIPEEITQLEPGVKEYFSLEGTFLISKFFEIIFQQTLIILLTGFLTRKMKLNMKETLISFLIIFGLLHLFAMLISGWFGGIFFTGSLIGAIIFPYLISRKEYGFIYSYIIHFLFHVVIGPLVWFYFILF